MTGENMTDGIQVCTRTHGINRLVLDSELCARVRLAIVVLPGSFSVASYMTSSRFAGLAKRVRDRPEGEIYSF